LIFKNTLEYGKVIIKTRQGETTIKKFVRTNFLNFNKELCPLLRIQPRYIYKDSKTKKKKRGKASARVRK
jgi:hypothetical protein